MKKCTTLYYENFSIGGSEETLDIEKNEESNQRRIKFFQDRWRTKEEWEELLDYLNDFVDNEIK